MVGIIGLILSVSLNRAKVALKCKKYYNRKTKRWVSLNRAKVALKFVPTYYYENHVFNLV